MKKLFVGSFVGMLGALFATLPYGNAVAQPVPIPLTLPMVKSPDAMRQYALTIASQATRAVSSASMDWAYTNRFTSTNATGTSAEDVLGKVFAQPFVYRLTNPTDTLTGYAWVYDGNGNLLFYASTDYTQADLAKSGVQYTLWMQDIPVLNNVDSGEILVISDDGSTAQTIALAVNAQHQLTMGQWYAGVPNGILSVRFTGGTLATYELWSPTETTPGITSDSSGFKISGHYILDGVQCPTGYTCSPATLKIIETYQLPTALLRLPTDQQINIDVMGLVQQNGSTWFERPYAMIVTPEGKDAGFTINLDTTAASTFQFSAGNQRVRFLFANFGQPGKLYTGPASGGKG